MTIRETLGIAILLLPAAVLGVAMVWMLGWGGVIILGLGIGTVSCLYGGFYLLTGEWPVTYPWPESPPPSSNNSEGKSP